MVEKNASTGLPADGRLAENQVERISRNKMKQLVVYLTDRDQPIVDVRVTRCFPWSLPDSYISVCDRNGVELVLIRDLRELDPGSRKTIEQELRDKVFHPKIRRVVDHKSRFGVTSITAETDRGMVTFQIRGRNDVRVLSPKRALFKDPDGNIYELTDMDALDSASRACLEDYF